MDECICNDGSEGVAPLCRKLWITLLVRLILTDKSGFVCVYVCTCDDGSEDIVPFLPQNMDSLSFSPYFTGQDRFFVSMCAYAMTEVKMN